MKPMRILVTGATGYVGSRLVTELLSQGHEVVAASRKVDRLTEFGWYDDVTAVALDAHDPASVSAAFAESGSVDVVYYLVHGIGQPGFRDADNVAASNVAEAAKGAGVRRIVYLGGFVPDEGELSEHLTSRAEVAEALSIDDGPELVWLGAAMIIGAGSTSFEMLRYVGDRFLVIPSPAWMKNPMDPISIRDVLYYLTAAADGDKVPAGAYDISGHESTTYRDLLAAYGRATGKRRANVPIRGVDTGVVSMVTAAVLPVPGGLASDLVESLDHPMRASDGLRDVVDDPPGGLVSIDDAIKRSLSNGGARPVNELADPHHLADTDPVWAGGDMHRIRQVAKAVTPPIVRPALGLLNAVPGPVAAALRTGLDRLVSLIPKENPA
ncbi:NAD-dependent epimerase [Mycobacteriaceae bacterium 1482268.1]|nr:NAD-dependent epimerase [Mycobacteriaceae bacterium 1482268.1]